MKKIINYLLFTTLAFSACKKGVDTPDEITTATDKAKLSVTNFASRYGPLSASRQLGLLINVNDYLRFVNPQSYTYTTGYFLLNPGMNKLSVDSTQVGVTGYQPFATVASKSSDFNANKYYSAILTGKIQQPDLMLLEDDLTRPTNGKAKVRFVNASPDLGTSALFGKLSTATTPTSITPLINYMNTSTSIKAEVFM